MPGPGLRRADTSATVRYDVVSPINPFLLFLMVFLL